MKSVLNRLRRRKKRTDNTRLRSARPMLEGLEDRMLLFATNGGAWTNPIRVTFSFMPDGTNIGGVPSNMYSTLNAVEPLTSWENVFLTSAAQWEGAANLNLVWVGDNGAPWGSSGNQQGDPHFGDIRIGMIPQPAGVLGFATLPPPINGGPDAGDIILNSNINWTPGAGYDLETVALHEFGHALGMDHSSQTTAVMYAYYEGYNQTLTSDDVAGIDSIYGAEPTPAGSNHTMATAWNLTPNIQSNGQILIPNLSILGATDADYWSVTVPANTNGKMTITMQSTSLSELSPKLVVYNSQKLGLATVSAPGCFGATASLTFSVTPGQVYYFRDQSAGQGENYGAYAVLVNFGPYAQAAAAPPNTVVVAQMDQGGGSENDLAPISTDLPGNMLGALGTASLPAGLIASNVGAILSQIGEGTLIPVAGSLAASDQLRIAPPKGTTDNHGSSPTGATAPVVTTHGKSLPRSVLLNFAGLHGTPMGPLNPANPFLLNSSRSFF